MVVRAKVKAEAMAYRKLLRGGLLLAILLSPLQVDAEPERDHNLSGDRELVPINITSDRLEVLTDQNLIMFEGNVAARQGDMSIYSDRMSVCYEDPKHNTPSTFNEGEIHKIVAEGHVKIVRDDRIASAERAVFFNEDQKIVLTGNPRVWQGKNLVKGDKITFYFKENRTTIERGKNKKVEATIYPE